MYSRSLSVLFACVSVIFAQSDEYSPFFDPIHYARGQPLVLHKRQNCPTGYSNCASLGSGADAACCPSNQNCAVDAGGHVACCPYNAVCTGTIYGTILGDVTTTTTGTQLLGATTTTTSSFNTANPAASITGVAGGGSTVPNVYYPFIYIPTSYANAALCSSAWTSCQAESTSCFVSVAGVYGVSVSGIAGGTTIPGSSAAAASSASSICSTLSTRACYNLQVQNCAQFSGNGAATANAAGPRPTPGPCMVYAMGAGAVVGAAGAFMQ